MIHYKNGIKDDNRIENLELWNKSHPYGQRVVDKIDFYKEFLDFYGYDVIERKKNAINESDDSEGKIWEHQGA